MAAEDRCIITNLLREICVHCKLRPTRTYVGSSLPATGRTRAPISPKPMQILLPTSSSHVYGRRRASRRALHQCHCTECSCSTLLTKSVCQPCKKQRHPGGLRRAPTKPTIDQTSVPTSVKGSLMVTETPSGVALPQLQSAGVSTRSMTRRPTVKSATPPPSHRCAVEHVPATPGRTM